MIATADIGFYFEWLHEFARAHFLSGQLPLWNPYNYCGTPFAANPQACVFYPLSWIYLVVGVIEAHKVMIALHSFLAGSFMYLFLRSLGPSRLAATVACLPYMFGNYFMANAAVGHLTMLFTMTWLPLALYFYERALRTGRLPWLFWAGFVLGIQFVAGEPQSCYYTALLLTAYGLLRVATDESPYQAVDPRRYWRWACGLGLVAVVAAATAAVQLIPTAEFAMHSDRGTTSYEFSTHVSMPLASLAEFIIPWSRGDLWGLGSREPSVLIQQNWEFAGYVGLFILVLAGASLSVRREPALLATRILFVIAILLMLGRFTPLYHVFYWALPGLKMFRIPARAIIIAQWAFCVMAAFGFDHLFGSDEARWRSSCWRIVSGGVLVAVIGFLVVAVLFVGVYALPVAGAPVFDERVTLSNPIVLKPLLLLASILAVIIALRWLPRKVAMGIAAFLVVVHLLLPGAVVPLAEHSRTMGASSVAQMERLRNRVALESSPYRVDVSPRVLIANAAVGAQLECVNGYAPLVLDRFYRFVHWMRHSEVSQHTRHELDDSIYRTGDPFPLRILNVRLAASWDRREQRYTMVENPAPLPRVWVVDRAEVISDDASLLARLRSPAFDPATTVLLERAPRITVAAGDDPIGTCRVTRRSSRELEIRTETTRNGYLVLSEVFYPGWRATVDGETVELERADYLITALPLPAGSHRVTYRYQPATVRLGLTGTAFSCLFAVGLLVRAVGRPKSGEGTKKGPRD